jgi:hypothetical protein
MKKALATILLLAAPLSALFAHDPASEMATAAKLFIKSLDDKAKKTALLPLNGKGRETWTFLPDKYIKPDFKRKGLVVKKMTPQQRILAHGLLSSALSHRGYLEATSIMSLEQILFDITGNDIRDPELYYVSIYGTPSKAGTWGWRFEGHHISLHFTMVNGRIFSVTPSFFGSNPAEVKEGPFKGLKVLADEENKARKLARSLSPPQRELGILSEEAPADILTKWDSVIKRDTFFPPKGLPITKMNSRQKGWLADVVEAYVAKHRPEVLAQVTSKNPLIDPKETYFAWAGSRSPGQGHYYRIQTPKFLFEYDCTQNGANHVHAVWRDFEGDFGRDLLGRHLAESHKPEAGWESLFDGKSLKGWKANENQDSFTVRDGCIVANAPGRCHLFYEAKKPFKNFEFKAEVMTLPHSNAGIYFHTRYQNEGWPKAGFECQVNNTYHDPKKTASIYGVKDTLEAPANDDEWFEVYIKVDGKKVVTKVNGKMIVEWTQPADWKAGDGFERILGQGTFALQGHDPGSTVLFRNLRVKRLP